MLNSPKNQMLMSAFKFSRENKSYGGTVQNSEGTINSSKILF